MSGEVTVVVADAGGVDAVVNDIRPVGMAGIGAIEVAALAGASTKRRTRLDKVAGRAETQDKDLQSKSSSKSVAVLGAGFSFAS